MEDKFKWLNIPEGIVGHLQEWARTGLLIGTFRFVYSDQTIKAKILEVLLFAWLLSRKDVSYHGECVLYHSVQHQPVW